ncbi:hypothetical protein FHG87_020199 [Trinorchestia longiramus]|nr:hypothetical protein FHG87_020199 [Trinorchestia longiramus]
MLDRAVETDVGLGGTRFSRMFCSCVAVRSGTKGYKLYDFNAKKVLLSRDVVFNESQFMSLEKEPSKEIECVPWSFPQKEKHEDSEGELELRRSTRNRAAPDRFGEWVCFAQDKFDVPRAYIAQYDGDASTSAFDGRKVKCKVAKRVKIVVQGGVPVITKAVVSDRLVDGVDVVLGTDVIDRLGGATVKRGKVEFGSGRIEMACPAIEQATKKEGVQGQLVIDDSDFSAKFNGEYWTVKWRWKNDQPVTLRNTVSCYEKTLTGAKKEEFEKEIDRWITEGILLPWEEAVDTGM